MLTTVSLHSGAVDSKIRRFASELQNVRLDTREWIGEPLRSFLPWIQERTETIHSGSCTRTQTH